MMNDKFSAQLRAHLLETADERAADGQLAAIVDGVAAASQRHPIVARLRSSRDGTGRSRTALGYALLAAALVVVLAALAIAGGGSVPLGPKGFEGTWASTDPGDGSAQTLVIGAGTQPMVHFEDAFATGAACRDDAVKRFTADGTGVVVGQRMDVTFPGGGGCGSTRVDVGGSYAYHASDDTLTDQDGARWVRVEGGKESSAEPSLPVESSAPSSDDDACTNHVAGDTYQAPAGSMTVRATLPGDADTTWSGVHGSFYLFRSVCLFGSPLDFRAAPVTRIYPDACQRTGLGVLAGTQELAVAALRDQTGMDVTGPVDVTVAGYPASRFDLAVPAGLDLTTCTDGMVLPMDGLTNMDPGRRVTVDLIDVDGSPLAFAVYRDPDVGLDLEAEVDSIIGSLKIERTTPPATSSPQAAPDLSQILATGSLYEYAIADAGSVLTLWDSCRNEFDKACGHAWKLTSASEPTKTGLIGLGDVHQDAFTSEGGFILVPQRGDVDGPILFVASDGKATPAYSRCADAHWSIPTAPGRLVWMQGLTFMDTTLGARCSIDRLGGRPLATGAFTREGTLWGLADNGTDEAGKLTIGRYDGETWQYHDLATPGGSSTSVLAADGPNVVVLIANQEISARGDRLMGMAVSTDGGATWSEMSDPVTVDALPFATYESDPDAQFNGYTSMAFAGPSTLYVSDRLGRLWRSTDFATFTEIQVDGSVDELQQVGDAVIAKVTVGPTCTTPCNRRALARISADGSVESLPID